MTTTVLMPVGIPGIGKSTLIAQQVNGRANVEVSRDAVRSKINGGDATFITTHHQHHRNIREEWKQGRKKPPTAADLRYQVKQGKGGLC